MVITKIMFRLITCGSGAVKEYFLVKQDLTFRPVASQPDRALPCAARKRLWLFANKNRSAEDLV
jgi:hypothetical protein